MIKQDWLSIINPENEEIAKHRSQLRNCGQINLYLKT